MPLDPNAIPSGVLEVCQTLEEAGYRAWVVGGCIRDLLMGREVNDWDLATSALPKQVRRTFRRTIPTGIQHGTVTVMHRGEAYEVTTLRGDGEYSDGRRPDAVRLGVDIEEDLGRRDFTVNAIAYDPIRKEVVDPYAGLKDLEARLIRAVGDPAARFGEDGLRVLRAARFCASLGFELDPETRAAIRGSLSTFAKVSPERVHEEWRKALVKSDAPSRAFEVMRDTGILEQTCDRLAGLDAQTWLATMERLDRAPCEHELRMAALFVDVPSDPAWLDGWLRGLRASNPERKRVLRLVAHVRVPDVRSLDKPALRRWMRAVRRDDLQDVLRLAQADGQDVSELAAAVDLELKAGVPLKVGELSVSGKDVMERLSLKPSRAVGEVLEVLLERVYVDPSLSPRERLLPLVDDAYQSVSESSG